MKKITFRDRLKYAFDNIMARGTPAMIGGLGIVAFLMILVFSVIVLITHTAPEETGNDFFQIFWQNFLRTMDAGTMAGDKGYYGLLMLIVTLGGIFTMSILIGILSSAIQTKLEELRKGRSRVIEEDHTVILGWSDQVYTIISELVITNESQKKKGCIVIMGDKDKVEMDDSIRDRLKQTGSTRVVCRQGEPASMNDLELVSLDTARSIIILSPEKEDPDVDVIKTILAITNNPARKKEPYHIVAEIRKPENMGVAKIVGKDEVEIILAGDVIARLIAQTCRSSSLSVIYTELLDFGGDEIYFKNEPSLTGKTFGEAIFAYEDSTVMGLMAEGKEPKLNPPMDTVIGEKDMIIAISEDASTLKLSDIKDYKINLDLIKKGERKELDPEHTLIIGWNWRAPTVINELDNYVVPGSSVTVVADLEKGEKEIEKYCSEKLKNQSIKFIEADTTDRKVLDSLSVEKFHYIIILCYADSLPPQEADAKTLITLLHLRDISDKTGKDLVLISEMLDIKNRDLAEIAGVDDFIVSDKLISLYITQVSENKSLNMVFMDLFNTEGSEIYLNSAESYVKTGEKINFYTLMEAARQRGEVALGYRVTSLAYNPDEAYGVKLNPDKSEEFVLAKDDRVIVLAEEGSG